MNIIKCPSCEAQYLPKEIFIPPNFFGYKKDSIEKDENGKICNVSSDGMDLQETYQCDYCNKWFKISVDIKFTTEVEEKMNFEDDYVQPIQRKILFLRED